MTLAIPSAATFAIARQVSLAEAWQGLVRYVRSKPLPMGGADSHFHGGSDHSRHPCSDRPRSGHPRCCIHAPDCHR